MTTTLSAQSIPPASAPLREDSIIMALVGLSHASSHFSHLLLPLMFPVFMKEFGWTFTDLGMMSSLFFSSRVRVRLALDLLWTVSVPGPFFLPHWVCLL